MTLARLLLEIRRRAASLPNDLPARMALEQAAREVLESAGQQSEPARKIMAALLGVGGEQAFDPDILDALTPEAVLRLDIIADRFLEFGRTDEAVRALRAALILKHAVRGHHAKEIAAALGISSRTVEVHKTRIMDKLEVRNIAELVRFAVAAEGPAGAIRSGKE